MQKASCRTICKVFHKTRMCVCVSETWRKGLLCVYTKMLTVVISKERGGIGDGGEGGLLFLLPIVFGFSYKGSA